MLWKNADLILPLQKQIRAWRKANRKMRWGIKGGEFDRIEGLPKIKKDEHSHGYIGAALFYGFGDDGPGKADPVLSGKVAWEYACKGIWRETWQCEYIDFNRTDDIRIRPGAPARPKGFYFAELQLGEIYLSDSVSQVRNKLLEGTGLGPEGLQLLAITHVYFQGLMNERKIPFMALADYDVAPFGFDDFFDVPQLFCSTNVFGLGIGNVIRNYPFFGIPTLRFSNDPECDDNINTESQFFFKITRLG